MATRFWVGGTGSWNGTNTTNWSTTSGGSTGAAVPTSSDDVTFDSNSGTAATVTIVTAGANANSITINKSDLTLTHSGVGSTVVGAVTLTTGTLNTNGQTCSWGSLSSSNNNARTLTLGGSAISLSLAGTAWACGTTGSLTVTANTATVTLTGAASSFSSATQNWNGLSVIQTGSGTCAAAGTSSTVTLANYTRTGTATKTDTISINGSLTVTGTLTLGGSTTQATNRLLVTSSVVGTQRTLNCTGGTVVINGDVDFQDISITGSPSWTNTGAAYIGDCGGNSSLITSKSTVAATQTWSGTSGGNWSANAWTSRVPLPQDNASIASAFTAAQTVTVDMPRAGADVDFTGTTGNPTLSRGSGISPTLFGSLTLVAAMTVNAAGFLSWTAQGRGNHTLTTAGNALNGGSLIFQGPGGTYTLQDDLTLGTGGNSGSLILTNGTFTANGKNVTAKLCSTAAGTTTNMGTGTWTITGTGTAWSMNSSATLNSSTSTLVISDTSSTSKTLTLGGYTYNNISITGSGTGAVQVGTTTVADTFNVFTIGAPKTVNFFAAKTIFVTSFVAIGTAGNVITLASTSGGTKFTLSSSFAGIAADSDYLSLTDSNATGGAEFYAGLNSTTSNISGWLLGIHSNNVLVTAGVQDVAGPKIV